MVGASPFARTSSLRRSRTPNTGAARSKIDNRTPSSFRARNASPSSSSASASYSGYYNNPRGSMSSSYHSGGGGGGYVGSYGTPSSSSGYGSQSSPMYR